MSAVVVDTSVVLKWFHGEGEAELVESRAVLAAHRDGLLRACVLDLGVYELGNVLVRALRWSVADTADQLDDLLTICGPPLTLDPVWLRSAAELAVAHRLTFYDAVFAAAARALPAPLVSADRQLLAAGLAESPAAFAARLGLVDPP